MSYTALILLVVVFVIILDSRNSAKIDELETRVTSLENKI